MKQLLNLIFTILLSFNSYKTYSCSLKLNKSNTIFIDSIKPYLISNATITDFNKAKRTNLEKIQFDTLTIKKVNGKILLPIENDSNDFVVFSDSLIDINETDIKEYKYFGQFNNVGIYIVEGRFWEHYECYLIDKRKGIQTTIWNTPIISTNEKFIANLSLPYGIDGIPNGIQIWRVNLDEKNKKESFEIIKHIEINQQIWIPEDLVWESDNSLLLKVTLVEKYNNKGGQLNESDFYYLRLKIK